MSSQLHSLLSNLRDNIGLLLVTGLTLPILVSLYLRKQSPKKPALKADRLNSKATNQKKLAGHTDEFVKPEIITTCGGKACFFFIAASQK